MSSAADTTADGPPMEGAGFREHYFTSQDNLSLYYRVYGDPLAAGTPAVCLPGLTRNSKDFDDLATRLSVGRRVICPDYRGRGRSAYDKEWRHYEPYTYINDMRHLLAVANVHRAAFIGTSLGGVLSMGLAVAAPTAVAGVILNDVGPDVNTGGFRRILEYISTDRPQPDWDSAARLLKTMFPKLPLDDDAGWLQMAHNTYRQGGDGQLHYDWDVNLAKPLLRRKEPLPDLWPFLRALRHVPVLAIRGEKSDILSCETFDRMAGELPHLTQTTVRGVGHAPSLAEPEAAAAIDQFLSRLDAAEHESHFR